MEIARWSIPPRPSGTNHSSCMSRKELTPLGSPGRTEVEKKIGAGRDLFAGMGELIVEGEKDASSEMT
jgi:hypothetical protein